MRTDSPSLSLLPTDLTEHEPECPRRPVRDCGPGAAGDYYHDTRGGKITMSGPSAMEVWRSAARGDAPPHTAGANFASSGPGFGKEGGVLRPDAEFRAPPAASSPGPKSGRHGSSSRVDGSVGGSSAYHLGNNETVQRPASAERGPPSSPQRPQPAASPARTARLPSPRSSNGGGAPSVRPAASLLQGATVTRSAGGSILDGVEHGQQVRAMMRALELICACNKHTCAHTKARMNSHMHTHCNRWVALLRPLAQVARARQWLLLLLLMHTCTRVRVCTHGVGAAAPAQVAGA